MLDQREPSDSQAPAPRIAQRLRAAEEEVGQLRLALESRVVIGQAQGIIMATCRLDADAAFDLLVKASQHQNRRLRVIADEVVLTGSMPITGG